MVDVFLPHPFFPYFPPQVVRAFLREPEILVGMQKFGLLFLAVSSALLGLVIPVEGVALVERETNAERFARGLPPLAPINRREGMCPNVFFSFSQMNLVADGGDNTNSRQASKTGPYAHRRGT